MSVRVLLFELQGLSQSYDFPSHQWAPSISGGPGKSRRQKGGGVPGTSGTSASAHPELALMPSALLVLRLQTQTELHPGLHTSWASSRPQMEGIPNLHQQFLIISFCLSPITTTIIMCSRFCFCEEPRLIWISRYGVDVCVFPKFTCCTLIPNEVVLETGDFNR